MVEASNFNKVYHGIKIKNNYFIIKLIIHFSYMYSFIPVNYASATFVKNHINNAK